MAAMHSYCIIHPGSQLDDSKFQYDSTQVKIEVPSSDSSGDPYDDSGMSAGTAEEDVIAFDYVFPPKTSPARQEKIFQDIARGHVRNALHSFQSAIFIASGATGSGKTFAVTGGAQRFSAGSDLQIAMAQSAARTLAPQAFTRQVAPLPRLADNQQSETRWFVWQLCQRYRDNAVEPSEKELEEWWARCCDFKPCVVVQAVEHQLQTSWNGQHDWRPPFRALHLLEFLRVQESTAKVAREAIQRLRPLLMFLRVELPQFCGVTTRLLFFDQEQDESLPLERLQGSRTSSNSSIAEHESDSQPESEQPLPALPQSKTICVASCNVQRVTFLSNQDRGLIPRSVSALFEAMAAEPEREDVEVSVSFYELYKDAVVDLLSERRRKVPIKPTENGPQLIGLLRQVVSTESDAYHLLFQGDSNRHFQSFAQNSETSRGHVFYLLHITQRFTGKRAVLAFVDLAAPIAVRNPANTAIAQSLDALKVAGTWWMPWDFCLI
eukprot:s2039_g5.t1